MNGSRSNFWPGMVLAIVSVAAATAVRMALQPTIGGLRFLTFFPAVIASALLGGPVAGTVATLLSATVVAITFGGPTGVGPVMSEGIAISIFVISGLMTVWLGHRVRTARGERSGVDDARLKLAAIVESSDEAIISKGLDGVIQSWNAAAARLYGYAAEEIVGTSIRRLVPPDLMDEQAAAVARLREGHRVEPFETVRLHQTGTPLRVLVTISPLRGPGGGVIGAVEVARDMGQRLQAEAALRLAKSTAERTVAQLRAVIQSVSEGVVVADADGHVLEWNGPALAAHGFATLEDAQLPLEAFYARFELIENGRKLKLSEWPMACVMRGESFKAREILHRQVARGVERIIDYSGQPVYDPLGRLSLAVLTMHDVTDERRAQQAMADTAERLSLALDAAGLGDWAWDVESDVVTLSPGAASLFGVSIDAPMTREAMRAMLHDGDRDRARQAAQRAVDVRGDYDIEYRINRPDGRTLWVAAKGRGQFDAAGNVTRMLGVIQDITARKTAERHLRESREWLELAVAIAQVGTFQLELSESTLTMNAAGRAAYGFSDDEPLTFARVRGRLHADDVDTIGDAVRQAVRPDGPRRFELEHRIVRPDGAVRWARVRGRALFEDTPGGPRATRCVGTFLDVTDQKVAEQQREQLLAAEQAARQQAEHTSRMKDEFLATLSHELRTPLNAILGWSQILINAGDDLNEVRHGLTVIERNARAQAQIIEDLLDMSRIISGKVRLDVGPVDLAALAATAVETVRPTAAAKGVRLTLACADCGPIVADPARVTQVLWNLLTNAIKFTPRDGDVRLVVRCVDGGIELCVSDSGEGIRPEFLPYVFDRFRQADSSTTRRHGGLGLGLAIVKQLAELHGGTVRVESGGAGRGAAFTVTLPVSAMKATLDATPPPAATPHMTSAAGGADAPRAPDVLGLRVVVLDDEPDARALIKRLLEDRGAVAATAASAAEAFGLLTNGERPDVLVSDIGMPGEDGYSLIARVRASGVTTPAVALTAYARVEDRDRAIAAGFQAHLSKPVETAELIATVARLGGGSAVAQRP